MLNTSGKITICFQDVEEGKIFQRYVEVPRDDYDEEYFDKLLKGGLKEFTRAGIILQCANITAIRKQKWEGDLAWLARFRNLYDKKKQILRIRISTQHSLSYTCHREAT